MSFCFTYLLFRLKLIQPSENTILFWMESNQVEKLEYALEYGNYKTRKLAAETLEHVGKSSSIPILLQAINDKVHNVSIAALNALETISTDRLIINSVIKRRFNWSKHINDINKKKETHRGKKYTIYRWERASKKSFDRVKEQLKRPMR